MANSKRKAKATGKAGVVAPDSFGGDFLVTAAEHVARAYPDLYRHQTSGVAFLLSRQRAILADDMGLGKTRTSIVAAREQAPDGPFLVVCPASVKLNWRREIHNVEPDADVQVLEKDALRNDARWVIINYDRLLRFQSSLLARRFAVVIVDEAHSIKNDSARSKRTLELLGAAKGKKLTDGPQATYLLTGTPMTNRPRDLFNLLKGIGHPLSNSFFGYAKRYCAATNNGYGLDTNGASNLEELAQVMAGVMLRRTKSEALDLPEKVRTWLPVDVPVSRTNSLERRALDYLGDNPARSGQTWITFLGMLNKARHALAITKAVSTADFVGDCVEAGQKVVVFTSYTGVVETMLERFGNSAVSLTGSHSAEAREAAVQRFQKDPAIRVFVGNIQAAGTGVTLTAGTHVVFNDLDWVPATHWQAEDRIHRIGQTQTAFVTYLYAPGTLDEFVADLLEAKAKMVGVIESAAAARSSLVDTVVGLALDGVGAVDGTSNHSEPATIEARPTMGLLAETLELLEAFGRTDAASAQSGVITRTFTSSSKPGITYVVEMINGVAVCDCPGFTYGGNCKHAREVLRSC